MQQQKRLILLIEDSVTVCTAMSMLLEKQAQWSLKIAHTLQEGQNLARVDKPDVVFMDYGLLGASLQKNQLLSDLRSLGQSIVLLTSPLLSEKINFTSPYAGPLKQLKKPFDSETFFKVLSDVTADEKRTDSPPFVSSQPALTNQESQKNIGQLSYAELERIARPIIEEIAWEVVPRLAESMIKEELERLLASSPPEPR